MSTTAAPPRDGGSRRQSVLPAALTTLAVAGAVLLATLSGHAAGEGSKTLVVLPLAAATGLALTLLALTRFRLYVLTMLALRASLDLAKLSARAAGNVTSTAATGRALDPTSILAVLFLLASGLWLAAQFRRQGRLPGSPLRRAMVCFATAGLISIPGSANHVASFTEALRILAVVAMFVVLEQICIRRDHMRQVLLAVYVGTVFPLLLTTFGFLTGSPRSESKGSFTRITGPFNQSNDFGRYLMLMIIFGVAVYPRLRGWQRQAMRVVLGLSAVFLFLTYTRTALLGTLLGVLVVAVVQRRKRILLGLAAACLVGLVVVPGLAARFSSVASSDAAPGSSRTGNSLIWRLNYWTDVLPLANSNPVTGIGLNMTQYQTDQAKQPHNDYVRAYVETGILGLIAYLSMLVALVALGRRAVRWSPPGSLDHAVGAGLLGCAVAFVAVSAAANVISNVVNLWYLSAFAAAASGVVLRQQSFNADRLTTDVR